MTTLLLLRHSIPERGGSSPDPGLSAEGPVSYTHLTLPTN